MKANRALTLPTLIQTLSLIVSVSVGLSVTASAQDVWKGGAGNWNDPSKWSAGVPTSSTNVDIDSGNPAASAVTVSDGEQSANLTIESDDSLSIVSGVFNVFGPTISNAGTISVSTTSNASLDLNGAVTLTGAGTLNMSNNANNYIFGFYQNSGATLTNQSTIQGSGNISPNCNNTFNNKGTVNANQSTALIISICNGPSANTGTLEATNGGTLVLEGNASGGGTFDNTGGGIIHADPSSIVQFYDSAVIKNATLTTTGSGVVECAGNNGGCTLDGTTNNGTYHVVSGGQYLANTVTNNGSFQMLGTTSSNVVLDIVGSVILAGSGTLNMGGAGNSIFGYGQNNGTTLTNQSTIQGGGTIEPGCNNTLINQHIVNANQSASPLYISICNGPLTNTGTMEATNGGTLVLEGNASGGGTFTNTGGTIHADVGSTVVLYDSAIVKNGNLTSSGTGKTQCNGSNGACTLDGVTISGTHQLAVSYENLANTVTNNGSFQMIGTNTNQVNLDINGSAILKGSGSLKLGGPGNTIFGFYQTSGATFTNDSTIQGGGTINPGANNNFINQHVVSATQNLTISGNFSNPGTLMVSKGKTLYISGGMFTNFTGSALSGGKYTVTGSLLFDGASLRNNAAGITLTGTTAVIGNQSAVNALSAFSTNESVGSFTVNGGQQFATTLSAAFSNAGHLTVAKSSGFKIQCTPTFLCPYTQTAGTTTVDGTLTAQFGVDINGGQLFGTGSIAASVTSKASVTAGDTTSKAGILAPTTYTQQSTGSLNIQLGGTTVGTQYSQLAVANGANINGTLNVKLIGGFVPAVGDVFTILTSSARSGTFSTVKLPTLTGAHFEVGYTATTVRLTVVSG